MQFVLLDTYRLWAHSCNQYLALSSTSYILSSIGIYVLCATGTYVLCPTGPYRLWAQWWNQYQVLSSTTNYILSSTGIYILFTTDTYVLCTTGPIGYGPNSVTSKNAVKWEGMVQSARERYRCAPHDLPSPTHTICDHFREKNFLIGYEPTPVRLQAVLSSTRRMKGPQPKY